jgi:pimeloyl-ACP methyl ester carboxylesterase
MNASVHARLIRIVTLILVLILVSPLAPVQAQTAIPDQLTLSSCSFVLYEGDKQAIPAQCGALSVPEDWSNPDGSHITLQFRVLPPLNANAHGLPIFHLEGGPGLSGIYNFGRSWYSPYYDVRKQHPVVIVDQRGAGRSSQIECNNPSLNAVDELAQNLSSDDINTRDVALLRKCAARLQGRIHPEFYTTAAAADDLDAIRQALKYDQIEIFANSYGTTLAQSYLKRHGDHAVGVLLDGVTGPWNNWILDSRLNAQAALDSVFALCKADAACNGAFPDLPKEWTDVLTQLRANAPTATTHPNPQENDLVVITAGRFEGLIREMLYNTYDITYIPDLIDQAYHHNYDLIANWLYSYAKDTSPLWAGMYYSIICSEMVAFYTDTLVQQYDQPTSFDDTLSTQHMADMCSVWPTATLTADDVAPVKSDRPVLILSGGLDPITPTKFAQETHQRLSQSTLAMFPYQAHGVLIYNRCAETLAATFFDNPKAKLDTKCVASDLKPLFVQAYTLSDATFKDPKATYSGTAPVGWAATQTGPLTVFSSPDKLMLAMVGIYKNRDADAVQAAVLKQLQTRFKVVTGMELVNVSTDVTELYFILPEFTDRGRIYIRTTGKDVQVITWIAPRAWWGALLAGMPTLVVSPPA